MCKADSKVDTGKAGEGRKTDLLSSKWAITDSNMFMKDGCYKPKVKQKTYDKNNTIGNIDIDSIW